MLPQEQSAILMTELLFAKYYSPEGTNIHGEGITPDVIVELPEDVTFASIKTNGIPDVTKDTQLQEALRILKEGR